jgi:threonylcarbamoyladenosine tRNA methylthiotransferase MtaB
MDGQLSKAVKEVRARIMADTAKKSRMAFFASQTGKTLGVLFETEVSPHVFEGYGENYVPVRLKSRENLKGKLLPVVLEETGEDFCEGRLL